MIFQGKLPNAEVVLYSLEKRLRLRDSSAIPDEKSLLWVQWKNAKLIIDSSTLSDKYSESLIYTAYIADKIEEFSKNNLLNESPTVKKILSELYEYIFLDLNYFKQVTNKGK